MARHDTLAAMSARELLGLWRAGDSKLHQIGLLKGLAPALAPKICELEAANLHLLLAGMRRQARPRCHATFRLCCVFKGLCWPSTPWRKGGGAAQRAAARSGAGHCAQWALHTWHMLPQGLQRRGPHKLCKIRKINKK